MITAILNLYNRPEYLDEQIEALRNQTVKVEQIIIWNNSKNNYVNEDVIVISSSHNFKFHGRFAGALLATTDYILLLDDDTIPDPGWVELCIRKQLEYDCLICGFGLNFFSSSYMDNEMVGWRDESKEDQYVHVGGQSWFFPYEYLRFFWSEPLVSLESGEDHHFAYVLQKNGIKTLVPAQDKISSSIKGMEYGSNKASSNTMHNLSLRQSILDGYRDRGLICE